MQVVLGDNGRIQGWTVEDAPPEDLLGEAGNGGPVREIIQCSFTGTRGVIQGDPLPLTILNTVVYVII